MRPLFLRASFIALALLLAAPAAQAQDAAALADRLNRLEKDVNFLQRKVYQGGATDPNDMPAAPADAAGLMVRLSQMEQQLRQMQGQIEEAQFAARKNSEELKKLSEDMEYRLQAIEEKQRNAEEAAAAAPASESPLKESDAAAEAAANAAPSEAPATYQKTSAEPAATGKDFPDANNQYNQAFKLLNDKKYSEAAQAFDRFVKAHPKDPLTSNAYYWLGESYYARGDYTRAAEGFRKGFEAGPTAQKAPDNLLKLGMALAKVKRTNEACIIFKQVSAKYADSAARTAKIAGDEAKAAGCK